MRRGVRTVGAHDDLTAGSGEGDRWHRVRGRAGRGQHGASAARAGAVCPRRSAVGAFGHDDVVLAGGPDPRVGPDGRELTVVVVHRECGEIIAADVEGVHALLGPTAEVAERELALVVEADAYRRADRGQVGTHVHAELLVDERRRVEVAERDVDAPILEHDRERALVEVAGIRISLLVAERAAADAQRGAVSADLDRRRPSRAGPFREHDRRRAERAAIEGSLAAR